MRKRDLSCEENHTKILRKIRNFLLRIDDCDLFNYKEIRAFREEIQRIKKNFQQVLSPSDAANLKEIEKILGDLRKTHPHLCSKESFIRLKSTEELMISETTSQTQNIQRHDSRDANNEQNMELDELLMKYNEEKSSPFSMIAKSINTNENQLPVASQKVTQEFNASSLNPIQKLYLQSLELWQCVDKFEAEKN